VTLPYYHGDGATGELPGVAYRRKQLEAAKSEMGQTSEMNETTGFASTGNVANREAVASAQRAYDRVRKAKGIIP
jgi:hypothetical protein